MRRIAQWISFPFLVMFSAVCYGQISNVPGIGSAILHEKKYLDVEGSPFLYPDWKTGSLMDNTRKTYPNQLFKYDTFQDEFHLNQEGKIIALSTLFYIKFEFNFLDESTNASVHRTFQSGFKVPGFSDKSYFEVLYDGSYKLLRKIKTDYMEQNVSSYGGNSNVKRFITRETYYLVNKSNNGVECRITKKSLLESLGDDKAVAEAYITKEKKKIKSEADFIEVLKILEPQ